MKIREVHIEKLFSLAKYNNERIGLTATIDDGENSDKVIAQLNEKIIDIEDTLQAYRELEQQEFALEQSVHKAASIVADRETQIQDIKVEIEELAAKGETGDIDAKLRHACRNQSYKQLSETVKQCRETLVLETTKLLKAQKLKKELASRVHNGNFSISDLDIPKFPDARYDF